MLDLLCLGSSCIALILLINITSFSSDYLLTKLDALRNVFALIGEVIFA
jgi:hypothetical protein